MEVILDKVRSEAHMKALEKLYTESFPPAERRAWEAVASPADAGCPLLRGVYSADGGRLLGLLSTWDFGDFRYVEHFAVFPELRGAGAGAKALAALAAESPAPVVLEVEPPCADNPMASRRIDFYRRNGFVLLDHDYMQPPYSPGLPWLSLRLMSTKSDTDAAAVERILHRRVYGFIS